MRRNAFPGDAAAIVLGPGETGPPAYLLCGVRAPSRNVRRHGSWWLITSSRPVGANLVLRPHMPPMVEGKLPKHSIKGSRLCVDNADSPPRTWHNSIIHIGLKIHLKSLPQPEEGTSNDQDRTNSHAFEGQNKASVNMAVVNYGELSIMSSK